MRFAMFLALTFGLPLLTAYGVDDPKKPPVDPNEPVIEFPKLQEPEVAPVVPLPPADPSKMEADQLYVVKSSVKLAVFGSPVGIVKVTEKVNGKDGSISIGGKFIDGNGEFEFREYTSKYVYIVRPVKKGKVELFFLHTLATPPIRKTLEVMGGGGTDPDTTEFQKALLAAYRSEPNEEKKFLPELIKFYSQSQSSVNAATTWVGLFRAMSKTAEDLKLSGHLVQVQGVIATELKKTFPSGDITPTLPITEAEKVNAKAVFKQIESDLNRIK